MINLEFKEVILSKSMYTDPERKFTAQGKTQDSNVV